MQLDAMSQIFISILGLALFTWVAKYFFVLYYYRRKKEDINRLEARTAVLRMLLKAKLKRKGSQIQDQYKEDKEFLGSVMSKLDLLTTFNFNRTSDYNEVIDILRSISEAIDMLTVKKNPAIYMAQQEKVTKDRESLLKMSGVVVAKKDEQGQQKTPDEIESKTKAALNSHVPQYDRWSQLLKYDKGNLYIIKEIVETTEDLKKKVDDYNFEQDNKELHLRSPELIEIDGFEGLKAIVDLDLETSKASKEARKNRKLKAHQDMDAEFAEISASQNNNSKPAA